MATKLFSGKSLSLVHVLAIVILFVVSIWNFAVDYSANRGKTQELIEFQKTKIEMALVYLPRFLDKGFEDLAIDFLEMGKVDDYYDFFMLKKHGKVVVNSANLDNYETRYIREGELHQEVKTPSVTFYVSKVTMGDYEVVLGYFPVNTFFTKDNLLRLAKANVLDFIVFFFAILLLVLKEVLSQTNLIRSGRREELERFRPTTVEAKLLKDLFLHASSLTKKNIDLEISDGVEVELSRGTPVGVAFSAGMIRVDLNNFTALCNEFGAGTLDSILSPIFSELREVAQRYSFFEVADGGDERVFYCRATDSTNKRAIAAVRGMFDVGRRYSPIFLEKFGFALNFKASFALGHLSLKKEDGKYKLKGDAYTYSQRCIETFKSRKQKDYVLAMNSKDFAGASGLVRESQLESQNLKGLGVQEIVFLSVLSEQPKDHSEFAFFLSNSEITDQLEQLLKSWNTDYFWALYEALKTFRSHLKDPRHSELLISLLNKLKLDGVDEKVIASMLMLLPKLAHRDSLDPSAILVIKSFLSSNNTRIKANALEALGDLGIFAAESRDFFQSPDNRTRANALVIVGRDHVDGRVLENLNDLLISDQELNVVSGLYVVDRLFEYHENQDLTLFKTAEFFTEAFSKVKNLKTHHSTVVQERARGIFDSYSVYFS